MAGMDKTEFQFPDEDGDTGNEIQSKQAKESEELSADIGDDDSIQVEVVDDTPTEDKNRKVSEPPEEVTEDELDSYSEKVRKRLQHFSKGYHDERRAKEQALRERQELERVTQHLSEENKKLKEDVTKNQQALLEQAKRVVANELDSAKRRYREAYDAGDSEAVVSAQEDLTAAKLKADKLASFKFPALQEENSRVENQQPAPAPVDERAKAWAEENSWFGTDDEMTSYALGLHNKLVKQNVDPRSDKYYEVINARMRELFPDRFELEEEQEAEVQPAKQRRANVVAPATRSTAPKKIKLTELQVNYAKKYNIPLEKYALEVAKLQRNKNG
jgi:hypothetical protein